MSKKLSIKSYQYLAGIAFLAFVLGCSGPQTSIVPTTFTKDKNSSDTDVENLAVKPTDNDGVSANVTASSSKSQVIKALPNSTLGASTLAISPGSLSGDTEISMLEASSLSNNATALELGYSTDAFQASGTAVMVDSSKPVSVANPMTLALPAPAAASLFATGEDFAVIYRVKDPVEGLKSGVIPSDKISVKGTIVEVGITKFGVYQVVQFSLPELARKAVSIKSRLPIKKRNGSLATGAAATSPEETIEEDVFVAEQENAADTSKTADNSETTATSTTAEEQVSGDSEDSSTSDDDSSNSSSSGTDSGGAPPTVSLSIAGNPSSVLLKFHPRYGSEQISMTLTNSGTGPSKAITMSLSNPTHVQILSDGCSNTVLAAGNSCFFDLIGFGTDEGNYASVLAITDTDHTLSLPITIESRGFQFISTWNTEAGTAGQKTITLPLAAGSNNLYIDWGDATSTTITTAVPANGVTHNYTSAGSYVIKISSLSTTTTFEGAFSFFYGGEPFQILEINQWGPVKLGNDGHYFALASNLNVTASDAPDLSDTTTLKHMFEGAASLNANLNHWDVSTITNFANMFYACANFNSPLHNWDMSAATSLNAMFKYATSFDQPIGIPDNDPSVGWDVSNVSNFDFMFFGAIAFEKPLRNWDFASGDSFVGMFSNHGLNIPNYEAFLIALDGTSTAVSATNVGVGTTPSVNTLSTEAQTAHSNLLGVGFSFNP